ncbi:GDSL-type esterase/lipase family protein [Virgisporangium aurantiacum]|uniref:CBM2 domain-containing protein n=1 Tax=Virgisporangium aurantiacum TaxID=175570 RepID=A0A8J3ZIE9_9ACTN|nr:GDSL-type esterase/lipase family protein [Virgisporangium aurantiacum]GIJ63532.1 hypothetical protein Vau01_110480 [Virgisporangium aurantiacum]
MRRLHLFARAGAALIIAVGMAAVGMAVGTAQAESNGGVRVMPLGDSITDGLTVPGGYRINLWQRLVAGGYTVDFVGSQFNGPGTLGDHDHEGHSGWRIDQIDANIATWMRTSTPRTVLLHIGTNDMFGNAAGAPARLSTLIDHITAAAPNAEVFVATIIPLSGADSAVRTFNAAIPGIVTSKVNAGRHVHLVDMFSALTTADLADGVHPNANGYNKMAAVWYNALLSVPASLTGGTPPSSPPSSPGGSCTATVRDGTRWSDRFNTEVTVTGTNTWTVVLALTSPQTVSSTWNSTYTFDATTRLVTLRPNGNGNVFGITTLANGNFTRPQVRSCTAA